MDSVIKIKCPDLLERTVCLIVLMLFVFIISYYIYKELKCNARERLLKELNLVSVRPPRDENNKFLERPPVDTGILVLAATDTFPSAEGEKRLAPSAPPLSVLQSSSVENLVLPYGTIGSPAPPSTLPSALPTPTPDAEIDSIATPPPPSYNEVTRFLH